MLIVDTRGSTPLISQPSPSAQETSRYAAVAVQTDRGPPGGRVAPRGPVPGSSSGGCYVGHGVDVAAAADGYYSDVSGGVVGSVDSAGSDVNDCCVSCYDE